MMKAVGMCSSCRIAVFRVKSSMFLSQESRTSKSTCSVHTVSDEIYER